MTMPRRPSLRLRLAGAALYGLITGGFAAFVLYAAGLPRADVLVLSAAAALVACLMAYLISYAC